MTDKPIPPNADDPDSWENLAKDLFGVEFDSPPVSSDDLDDELLNDDFLKDDDEADSSAEPETSAETQAEDTFGETSPQESEDEPAIVSFAAAEEPESEESRPVQASNEVDLDVLLDFSQPLDDDADTSVAPARSEAPTSGSGASFFEKLAAESDEFEEKSETATFEEHDVEIVDEDESEDDDEDEDMEFDDDEDLETDDFWDALDKFSPEELGTPHVDRGQTRGGKPPRDPEIGLVSGSAANDVSESPTFETGFESDADFGLGILEDVETDEDDDADDAEAVESGRGTDSEGDREEKKPRRRRRRRRRGGRKQKPVSETEGESADADEAEAPRQKPVQSRSVSEDIEDIEVIDDEDLSDDLSQEETGDNDDEISRDSGSSRYKNIPTWSEAIELIADRKAKSSSESRGRRGTRSDTKNRKRGGRRRRPRKPSS